MRPLSLSVELCFALLLSTGCVTPRPSLGSKPQGPQGQIADWEDRRSLGNGALARWAVSHPDPAVRVRSLLALARIQAASTAPAVAQALADPSPTVRREAAFAAGLLGLSWTPLPEPALALLVESALNAEAKETDGGVAARLVEALGRLASERSRERLLQRLEHPVLRVQAAVALGAAAKRGAPFPKSAIPALTLLAGSAAPADRYAGVYALALSKLPEAAEPLGHCGADPLPDVRALCAKGLGEVGAQAQTPLLAVALLDPDPRVAAEAARALARMAGKCGPPGPCPALSGLEPLVSRARRIGEDGTGSLAVLALAQQGLPAAGRPLLERVRRALNESGPNAVHGAEVAQLDCRLAATLDRQQGVLDQCKTCGRGLISEPVRMMLGLHELALSPPLAGRVKEVAPFLARPEPELQTAALGVLAEAKDPAAIPLIQPYLQSADPSFVGSAVSALTTLKAPSLEQALGSLCARVPSTPDLAAPLADAIVELQVKALEPSLRAWLSLPDTSTRHIAAAALTKLTGARVEVPDVERPPSPSSAANAPSAMGVRLRTAKGTIDVRLDLDEAPRTSENFLRLTREKYFRNLTFHRVVPDFVAQAGAPRLDGDGSPGFTLPCEMTHATYARGAIGMALSGKDTGGTQFFFTTAPQPHLDGRYTRFGEVVEGMSVVDALLEGDRILEVEIMPLKKGE